MEHGKVYIVRDKRLGTLTKVLLKANENKHFVCEVLGRIEDKRVVVTYIEECPYSDEYFKYHKVSHKGTVFYIVESRKYGEIEFSPVPYLRLVVSSAPT